MRSANYFELFFSLSGCCIVFYYINKSLHLRLILTLKVPLCFHMWHPGCSAMLWEQWLLHVGSLTMHTLIHSPQLLVTLCIKMHNSQEEVESKLQINTYYTNTYNINVFFFLLWEISKVSLVIIKSHVSLGSNCSLLFDPFRHPNLFLWWIFDFMYYISALDVPYWHTWLWIEMNWIYLISLCLISKRYLQCHRQMPKYLTKHEFDAPRTAIMNYISLTLGTQHSACCSFGLPRSSQKASHSFEQWL